MFRLTKPSESVRREILLEASAATTVGPKLLSLTEGCLGTPPRGFERDFTRAEIGRGALVFPFARELFLRWRQFDLGWVGVVDWHAPVMKGQLVGVEVHTGLLWSVSVNRIVEFIDEPNRFGFMYAATAVHVEEGQERFVIEFDPLTESVSYLIEAVSRPKHPLARLGYPITRAMQHRFARDSLNAIKTAIARANC